MLKHSKYFFLACIGLLLMPLGYSALTDDLVLAYTFNNQDGDNSANTLNDLSDTGTPISYSNTGGVSASSGYFAVGNNAGGLINTSALGISSGNYDFAYSMWIKTTNVEQHGTMLSIGADAGGNYKNIAIYSHNEDSTNGNPYMDIWGEGNHFYKGSEGATKWTSGNWINVIMTYDAGTQTSSFYVNGVLNSTKVWTNTFNIDGGTISLLTRFDGYQYNGDLDEVYYWERELTLDEIYILSNTTSNSFYPFSEEVYDYNVTQIFDNTSWLIQDELVFFNSSQNFLFTAQNSSNEEVSQLLTYSVYESGNASNIHVMDTNFTAGTNISITFDADFSNYTIFVTNPFNSSVNLTKEVYINEIVDIRDNSLRHFNFFNTSVNLNFSSICLCGGEFFMDNYNLTIPDLNITNRLSTFGSNDSVTFNNSAVFNYTVYVTHERFGNIVNKTFYFYTNAYNLSIPSYNSTIANNSYTDIKWYLTTTPNYATSNQAINVSINFNGITTYPTATGLNYSYIELLTTTELVENLPFNLLLNITLGNESLLFNQSYTQTITTIQIDNCDTYTNVLLNLSMLNEIGKTYIINVSSIVVNFNISNALISVNIINDTDGIIPICINNTAPFYSDVEFQFEGVGYGATDKKNREHFYINNYFVNNETQQQSTFQLLTDFALKKKFIIFDSSDKPLINYYVVVKKWYGDGYETVAMAKTDINGEALTYLEYYNTYYALDILDTEGELIYTVSKNLFSQYEDTIRVSDTAFSQYNDLYNSFSYTRNYNETSNVFSTTITNEQGTESIIRIIVKNQFGVIQCDDTYTTSSVTATCTIINPEGNTYTAQAYAQIGTQNIYLYVFQFTEALSTMEDYGQAGSFYSAMIVLSLSLVGILFSFASVPIMAFIGLLISTLLGFIALDVITLAGIGVISVLMIVWFLRK